MGKVFEFISELFAIFRGKVRNGLSQSFKTITRVALICQMGAFKSNVLWSDTVARQWTFISVFVYTFQTNLMPTSEAICVLLYIN